MYFDSIKIEKENFLTVCFVWHCFLGVLSTVKSGLDREKQSQYLIAVQAKDMPEHSTGNSATTIVTINIKDINDNIATFKSGKSAEKNKIKIKIS